MNHAPKTTPTPREAVTPPGLLHVIRATGAEALDLAALAGALAMVVEAAKKEDVLRAWRADGQRFLPPDRS